MIQYFSHKDIDKKKWDNCINLSFNGNMYALSWYLDVVHSEWEALVEDDYDRVMPLSGAKKLGIWYLFQPSFTQQLGVFSKTILNAKVVDNFLNHIPDKYRFAEINLNIHNRPSGGDYQLIPRKNYLLDLFPTHPKLSSKYAVNTKRNLKKAHASDLALMKGIQPESLVKLFRENKGKQVKHWKTLHYLRLQRLMYTALYRNSGIIYGVYTSNNELCAGAFFLHDRRHLIFLFSATNDQARKSGAMSFLLDTVIQEFASSQMVLDFEGSNDPHLARFYKSFGAKEVGYKQLAFNHLPFPLNVMARIKNKWKA